MNAPIALSEFFEACKNYPIFFAKDKEEKFSFNGFFIINEDKLKHLSKKKKDDICEKNAYALITAHLISLSNIQKLGSIK